MTSAKTNSMSRSSPSRRKFLLSTVGVLATGGCLEGTGTETRPDAVGIQIDNNTSASRQVTVSATNSEVEFEKEYEVPAGERIVDEGVLPTGMYEVVVEVEGVGKETEEWYMNGCKTNNIIAMFSENGISIGATCYDD
ncbi:hypothetical protein B4589_010600 [Halolamina sp. CBA1230]|uniref:hypothetical protein n=1 Tax=Halolamina sp. CBA1230 TaxID=1853690 RepID=UPI00117A550A|nr:hypothetical protein [Halolamina sp. CBA1230]QKY20806.1 hypothetical protein B4589_010600 [Halolamina sp. CBA1230]